MIWDDLFHSTEQQWIILKLPMIIWNNLPFLLAVRRLRDELIALGLHVKHESVGLYPLHGLFW